MNKKILVVSGSPRTNGNTALLVQWFADGAAGQGACVETVNAAAAEGAGCRSCRICQTREEYGCVVKDGISPVLLKMIEADAIVMATPLYFFSASAQIKRVFDRMFSLYKWDNEAGTMRTVLKGKTLALIASAFEGEGLDCLERPFEITAGYTGMEYASLLVPFAGVSRHIEGNPSVKREAMAFGKRVAGGL